MFGDMARRHLTGYMVTRPEKASLYEILRLLLSGNAVANKALDCPVEEEAMGAERRWLIAASLLLQKVFGTVKRPMLWTGTAIEWMANLVWNGNGIGGIASDLLQGCRPRSPNTKSVSYRSIISLLDDRTELDKKIGRGDARYRASLCVMASKLAYENPALITHAVTNLWNMHFVEYFDCSNAFQEDPSTQAFMFADRKVDAELIVVAFRGTEVFNMDDWSVDVDFSWYEIPNVGKIHLGFMKALGLQLPGWWPDEPLSDGKQYAYYVVRDRLKNLLRVNPNARFVVTGHSLGGALAILFPLVLALHREEELLGRLDAVYTFGQPRVGDEQLGKFMSPLLDGERQRYFRFVYNNDVVPHLPFDAKPLIFKHWGRSFYYDTYYKGQVIEGETEKNYFSLMDIARKRLIAGRELLRSFWIGRVEGPEYREGWAETAVRLGGLVIPGLANHLLQDYVNCTRLGNPLEASASGYYKQD